MKRRGLALGMAVVMAAALLGGCARGGKREQSVFEGSPGALRVFVRANSTYADRLVEQFPDIKFDFYYYGGLNTTMTMNQLLRKDDFGDICISSLQVTDDIAKEHLVDLAGSEVCGRYEPSILSQFDVEGSIYQLPGYVTMRNIVYNKEMFAEHGWKEPESFGELVDLCAQIREETEDITPIVMGAAAGGYYFTTMTSYAQAEFLYTPEGRKWMEEYQKGNAGAKEGFGEGIRMVQELIDARAFDHDKNVGLWDGELFEARMMTDEAAMMYAWGGQSAIAKYLSANRDGKFGLLPFRNRDGQAFIGTNIPYYIGLSKVLKEKGNEKKFEQAMRVIDWMSTEEGISALSVETLSSAVYPLRSERNAEALKIYQDFWNAHLDSIKAPMLYAGYEDILVPTADRIIEAVKTGSSLDGLDTYIDELHQEYLSGGAEAIEVGSVAENFTHRETVQIFADVLHEKGDSDIALVSDGVYKDGVMNTGGVFSRFLEGPLMEDELSCSLPGKSVTGKAVQMTLTGKEVRELLEKGKCGNKHSDSNETFAKETDEEAVATASFDYYWAGMDVKWRGDKVTSIKLGDGKELADEDTCTVTFAERDYTEETEKLGSPKELPYTAQEALMEYMKEHSPVRPVPVLR